MWKSKDGAALKLQLQHHFRNMTKAMDCVGCEKCKLWGKLQLLGKLSIWSLITTASIAVLQTHDMTFLSQQFQASTIFCRDSDLTQDFVHK